MQTTNLPPPAAPSAVSQAWDAWQERAHAGNFDARSALGLRALRGAFESFNETRLFLANKSRLRGRSLIEIGCATGEFYRYLHRYHPDIEYAGHDVSFPAVERARSKYPGGSFTICRPDLSDLVIGGRTASVVWARDVAHHQPRPFEFLQSLLTVSQEAIVLRLRTRDVGATVADPAASCQWENGHWVPYLVLNIDDVVRTFVASGNVSRIEIVKQYVPLGGRGGRYLPKDCYDPATGTAETAVFVTRGPPARGGPQIVVSSRLDTLAPVPFWKIALRAVRSRVRQRTRQNP